jgi:hypothetical protein
LHHHAEVVFCTCFSARKTHKTARNAFFLKKWPIYAHCGKLLIKPQLQSMNLIFRVFRAGLFSALKKAN